MDSNTHGLLAVIFLFLSNLFRAVAGLKEMHSQENFFNFAGTICFLIGVVLFLSRVIDGISHLIDYFSKRNRSCQDAFYVRDPSSLNHSHHPNYETHI